MLKMAIRMEHLTIEWGTLRLPRLQFVLKYYTVFSTYHRYVVSVQQNLVELGHSASFRCVFAVEVNEIFLNLLQSLDSISFKRLDFNWIQAKPKCIGGTGLTRNKNKQNFLLEASRKIISTVNEKNRMAKLN